jgi:hypothetical protein
VRSEFVSLVLIEAVRSVVSPVASLRKFKRSDSSCRRYASDAKASDRYPRETAVVTRAVASPA